MTEVKTGYHGSRKSQYKEASSIAAVGKARAQHAENTEKFTRCLLEMAWRTESWSIYIFHSLWVATGVY